MSDATNPVRATGRCLCGSVRYRVLGPLRTAVVACHCVHCRRFSGGVFAGTTARREDVVIEDDGSLKWYRATSYSRRGFCGRCGSSLFREGDGEPLLAISAASLDEPTGLKLAIHAWTSEAADYWSFDPEVPTAQRWSGLAGPEA